MMHINNQKPKTAEIEIVFPGGVAKEANCYSVSSREARRWVGCGTFIKHVWRYRRVTGRVYDVEYLPQPLLTSLFLKLLCRGNCGLVDRMGVRVDVGFKFLARTSWRFFVDLLKYTAFLHRFVSEIEQLEVSDSRYGEKLDLRARPLYLRTDLWMGVSSGGSVGHIAGVFNNLSCFCGRPILFTTDLIPTVRSDLECHQIRPNARFLDFRELPGFSNNEPFVAAVCEIVHDDVAFVYQRYSLGNVAGLRLARELRVPFVLEYNGSEVWISRNWGSGLKYEDLSARIELVNLRAAHLIVVVSQPMRDELVKRGISPERILVNPNGVDPDLYSPEISGRPIRDRYDLNDSLVLGFIGTFGKWHGAEVLAEAFGRLLVRSPELRSRLSLLMVGDGQTMGEVREIIASYEIEECVILTGSVPQQEGPSHLAACDILVSPHVPNPDGTPFFGSPTKLFEYMAMGKAILASDLDQIGEVLGHGQSAWLVRPGDAEELVTGIEELVANPMLRARLGSVARQTAVKHHTWNHHTERIVSALAEKYGSGGKEDQEVAVV